MNNLITRAWAGLLFVLLFLTCLYFGSWYWMALLVVFYANGLSEFLAPKKELIFGITKVNLVIFAVLWLGLSIGSQFYFVNYFERIASTYNVPIPAGYIVSFILAIPLLLSIAFIVIGQKDKARFETLMYCYFGVFYIGYGVMALGFLRHNALVNNLTSNQLVLAVAAVAGVWVSDTFAYLTGKKWGKRKLAPSISPNKSVEGFIGGMVVTIIFEVLFLSVFNDMAYIPVAIVYGGLLAAVATAGDLVQSMWKRSVGIKDSGNIIPGHGGVLDRIDAQLLAAPFSLFFWIIVNNYFVGL